MKKFFSRHNKARQTNDCDDGNHNQQLDLNSNDQSVPNLSLTDVLSDPQDNDNSTPKNTSDNSTNHIDDDTDNSNNNNVKENKRHRRTIKHAATLPIQTQTFYYTVQEGDTLQIISEKYHIKESIIKKANRIDDSTNLHEGDIIQLFVETDDTQKYPPIEAFVYDAKTQTDIFPGKLTIKKGNLVFSKKSLFHHHHHINLCGYLESNILPHPSQNLNGNNDSIFVINYLKIPTDKSTSVTEYFSGRKDELEKLRFEIIKTADFHQEKVNYQPPNPDSIFYSQEFADNASIPKKRRKSTFGRNKKKEEQPKSETPAGVQTMKIFLPTIQFLNGQLDIIKKTDVFLVRKKLPARYQNANWMRLFQTSEDGFNLKTFFRKVANKRPLLLFLKTFDNDVVGAFIPAGLSISTSFYGTIDTFVFRFVKDVPTHELFITKLDDLNGQKSPENTIENKDQKSTENIIENNDQISSENKNENDGQIGTEIEIEIQRDDQISSEKNNHKDHISKHRQSDLAHNDRSKSSYHRHSDLCHTGHANKVKHRHSDFGSNSLASEQNDTSISEMSGQINSEINENSEDNDQNTDQIISENEDEEEHSNSEDIGQINPENKNEEDHSNSETNDQKDDQITPEIKNEEDHSNSETNDQKDDQITPENKNDHPNDQKSDQSKEEAPDNHPNSNKPSQKERTVLEVFRWSKMHSLNNRNFVLSNLDCIIFGGGESSALYIDKEMYSGYSDPCDTFDSPRLTKKKRFDVSVIEVWQIA